MCAVENLTQDFTTEPSLVTHAEHFSGFVFYSLSNLSPSINNENLTALWFLSTNFQLLGPQSIFKLNRCTTTCQLYEAFFGPCPHPHYYFTSLAYVLVRKFFDNSQVGHGSRRDPSTKSAPPSCTAPLVHSCHSYITTLPQNQNPTCQNKINLSLTFKDWQQNISTELTKSIIFQDQYITIELHSSISFCVWRNSYVVHCVLT